MPRSRLLSDGERDDAGSLTERKAASTCSKPTDHDILTLHRVMFENF